MGFRLGGGGLKRKEEEHTWTSMSLCPPCTPPRGWWIIILEFGKLNLFPRVMFVKRETCLVYMGSKNRGVGLNNTSYKNCLPLVPALSRKAPILFKNENKKKIFITNGKRTNGRVHPYIAFSRTTRDIFTLTTCLCN